MRQEFEDWHSHEHFPERLGVPGFMRATRWTAANGGDGVFVMYELRDFDVLTSSPYLARLNAPTPWSTKLMPFHRQMVRSQSRVLRSHGGCVARHVLTLRLSPAEGRRADLEAWLDGVGRLLASTRGFVGAHLLEHETPAIPKTTEQRIRGSSDQVADWVFLVCAYEADGLAGLLAADLSPESCRLQGAAGNAESAVYSLSYSAMRSDTEQA